MRAALFGVPERTTDSHLHANPNLRVGVVLECNGERLTAMRRKARKNSLIKYDPLTGEEFGEAIPDEVLSAWMGGLTEGLYTSMFGLDHDELVAGGKALSEGKGELGQSLFEAGAGLSSVRALRERLAKEADDLFRPRASSSAIHKVLEQYGEARKEAKQAQTKPAEWETLRKAAEEARAAYADARAQQELLQQETRRFERLAAVLLDVAGAVACVRATCRFGRGDEICLLMHQQSVWGQKHNCGRQNNLAAKQRTTWQGCRQN
ncbi:MAG: AAA family ATPase [Nitrosomonadales bacterium]|nr:AAA family ATPase [Nitrosomonadales bacterium]